MFCPECESEFRPGFTRCNECDVDLVERLENPSSSEGHEDPDYVPISTAQGMLEEGQVRAFLEANGIPTQVYNSDIARKVYGFTLDGLGAARIYVPRELAATARELLEKAQRGELEIEESPE